jgi:hypothetical protein
MKIIIPITVTVFFLLTIDTTAHCQEVEDIIEKHITAQGGYENWNNIQSMKITGMFTAFSEVKPFEEYKARGGRFYSGHHKGQYEITEGCDGKTYWVNDPWFELGFPHIANEAEQFVIEQKAEFCTPFFNYRQRGFMVNYEGMEEAEGKNTHKLALTREDGKKEFWFLDVETYLPVKHISQWADFAGPALQEVFFDDYRKVNGVMIPFYTERLFSIRHRITEIREIEINPTFDYGIFNFPKSPQMEKIAFMEGNWSVVYERMGRNRQLNFADSTVSKIAFAESKNLLEEAISYSAFFTIGLKNTFSYNSQYGSYIYTSFNGFNSVMEIYSGHLENDSLNFKSFQTINNSETQEPSTEILLEKISDHHFIISYFRNNPDGNPPEAIQRFTYRRI